MKEDIFIAIIFVCNFKGDKFSDKSPSTNKYRSNLTLTRGYKSTAMYSETNSPARFILDTLAGDSKYKQYICVGS